MALKDIEDMREKIISWLKSEGLYQQLAKDEDVHFMIAAEYPAGSGRHFSIIQPKGHDDMILVTSRIKLIDNHQKALQAMSPKDREAFLWRMRYDLLNRDSSFEMHAYMGNLQSIRFLREIYYDALNKNKLMEAVRDNLKCELYVVWRFQEAFGYGAGSQAPAMHEPMYS
jgi:hypothetical protein